jgi:hypothetical protein
VTDNCDVTPDGQKFLVTRWSEDRSAVTEPAHIVVVENWIRAFR